MDFIPLVTDDYRMSFCKATEPLPNDIKELIWKYVMKDPPLECPPAPKKRY